MEFTEHNIPGEERVVHTKPKYIVEFGSDRALELVAGVYTWMADHQELLESLTSLSIYDTFDIEDSDWEYEAYLEFPAQSDADIAVLDKPTRPTKPIKRFLEWTDGRDDWHKIGTYYSQPEAEEALAEERGFDETVTYRIRISDEKE